VEVKERGGGWWFVEEERGATAGRFEDPSLPLGASKIEREQGKEPWRRDDWPEIGEVRTDPAPARARRESTGSSRRVKSTDSTENVGSTGHVFAPTPESPDPPGTCRQMGQEHASGEGESWYAQKKGRPSDS
jgi:hypothetical protein